MTTTPLRWALWNREEIIFWENGIVEKRAHRTFSHPCRKLPIIIPPNEESPSPTDIYINATNGNSGLDFSNRFEKSLKWQDQMMSSSQAWASWCVTKNQNFAAISSDKNYYLGLFFLMIFLFNFTCRAPWSRHFWTILFPRLVDVQKSRVRTDGIWWGPKVLWREAKSAWHREMRSVILFFI